MPKSLQPLFEKLRTQYPVFCFESFTYTFKDKKLDIKFTFSIGKDIVFTPQLSIPERSFYSFEKLSKQQLDLLVFNIGMVELVSYWKCTCSPLILVKPFSLNEAQIIFWKKLYFNGLGEFFYLNGIETDLQNFVEVASEKEHSLSKQHFALNNKAIVPIGGGKDSVVTLGILKDSGVDLVPMIINPRGATLDCIAQANFSREDIIEVNRTIDAKLLELNAQGFLNGHTPFSAMLAFVSLLCAALSGNRNIALSNESSANESTVQSSIVNHQYSKSIEFEEDFRSYVKDFISDDFNYFSFLRPLNELQIALLFSRYKAYHTIFRSCNAGSKTDIWCASCAKCMFVYIILSPFVQPENMQQIFGKDLFDSADMELYFNQLIGIEKEKPFECVGTIEEVNAAIQETIKHYYEKNRKLPLLLQKYENLGLPSYSFTNLINRFEENCMEEKFSKILINTLNIVKQSI